MTRARYAAVLFPIFALFLMSLPGCNCRTDKGPLGCFFQSETTPSKPPVSFGTVSCPSSNGSIYIGARRSLGVDQCGICGEERWLYNDGDHKTKVDVKTIRVDTDDGNKTDDWTTSVTISAGDSRFLGCTKAQAAGIACSYRLDYCVGSAVNASPLVFSPQSVGAPHALSAFGSTAHTTTVISPSLPDCVALCQDESILCQSISTSDYGGLEMVPKVVATVSAALKAPTTSSPLTASSMIAASGAASDPCSRGDTTLTASGTLENSGPVGVDCRMLYGNGTFVITLPQTLEATWAIGAKSQITMVFPSATGHAPLISSSAPLLSAWDGTLEVLTIDESGRIAYGSVGNKCVEVKW